MAALDKKESPQLGFLHPVSGARNDHDEVLVLGRRFETTVVSEATHVQSRGKPPRQSG